MRCPINFITIAFTLPKRYIYLTLTRTSKKNWNRTDSLFSMDNVKNLLDIAFTTLPIVVLVLGWKRLPLHFSLFALAVIVFSLSVPIETVNPLTSQPRYMIVAFPFIVILALWGKRPRFDQFFMALGPPLLALNTILFIGHYWVA